MKNIGSDHSPGHAALRKGRVSLSGHVYLVTFATWNRRPLFADPGRAAVASRTMAEARSWKDAGLLAWVLMPDHWHGLIQLGSSGDLSGVVRKLKCNSARLVRSNSPDIGQVWARAFHDHALRSDESLVAAAEYLMMNPVRAGLANNVGGYPFWDAWWL
jgi:putative transposase